MIRLKQPKTLKMKLTLYFTMVTLLPSSLIGIFYYYYSTQSLKKNMIENARTNTSYIMNNIDNQIKLAYRLSDWTFLNKNFEKVFINNSLEGANLTEEIINAKQTLEYYVMNSPIAKNISSIVISGNNNVDIRLGDDAAFIDKYELMKKPWFLEGYNRGGAIYLPGILENPAYFKRDDYVIPIVRPVIHSTIDYNIGWSYISFKESLISDVYKGFSNPIYIIDRDGICISSSETQYIAKSMKNEEDIKKMMESNKDDYFDIKVNEEEKLVVFYKSSVTGWSIVQKISYTPLIKQKAVVFRMSLIIFCGSILITFIFTMFLSSNLTAPLKKILRRMDYIAEGNFERDKSLEGLDEMGELGRGINELASSIKGLLQKVKEEEADKRVLELKVLENQINPHFLYNTLNSIKWMATVQKADGIRDIVSSLGRLLMNISKNASERISIRKELALTEDYIFIQNIRYNGKIKLELNISDEALLENEIVKFTLQPIVENAIFHGIEPKKDAGNIKIGIEEKEQKVIVSVEDDGVGIAAETLKEILTKADTKKNRGLSGIGMKNVDERLKLNYGEGYGLSIESVPGAYTRVNVIVPKSEVDKMAGDLNV
jgi:two-component system sensor histidine kinase YesM